MPCDREISGQLGGIYFACACRALGLASSRANSDFGSGAVYVDHGGVSGEVNVRCTRVYYAGGLYGSWIFLLFVMVGL